MIGVELRSTWTKTRKANGDIVESRVSNTTRQWKAGKFMPLNMRGWSINQYCLSKVWFKTHSVDLRVMDITKITSSVKSWLYADHLIKPEEMIMYRPASYGGLGILNVKYKAMAGMIKTFLETAGHDKFRPSQYHTTLFRFHILGDISLPNPGLPPFYSEDFFATIRKVHLESPLNIFRMSEKEWYTLLVEDNCTKEMVGMREEFIKCRVERANPGTDWENTWRLARLPGLGPDNTSFLLRVIHQLLPTKERVARTRLNANSSCKALGCQENVEEGLTHALIYCQGNDRVGINLLEGLRGVQPDVQADAALRLEFKVVEDLELPMVWLTACVLRTIWNLRLSNTRVRHYVERSQLEAEINLLRETRHRHAVPQILELAENLLS